MKLGIVISSNDPETVWNAFRFGSFALGQGDVVNVCAFSTMQDLYRLTRESDRVLTF